VTDAEDLEARVQAAIAGALRRSVPPLSPDDDLVERLGLDSLEGLRLLAAIEKRLAVRFADDRLAELRTLRAIVEAVRAGREGERR
jgi:acyl carrier protein